ncbi:uncharacterized protein BT62DRAFT_483944 [Guyanagaster necrorhizus]|uniref:Uncharacterized protein n=1 Tax=Guyanagaster necrorhizus TaxID=856835 RepID=A0A9P7VKB9_9AGAR|nr:uncharacterized protein BT62DRAFT_483944 [Guyanagaster necrorhizus MCA 3950]KAG7441551.1 hypothetical protein BT62DRAFT_483944 [Guyanagaster necrorhizus MCA 3950]
MEGASSSNFYSGGHRGNGGVVQEFVNETFAASNESSTRSDLLSSPSQETGAVQRPKRRRNGPSERFRRERELIHGQASHKQLLRLVIDQEYEANKMRKAMIVVLERLEHETQRATAAEDFSAQLVQRFQLLNEGRLKMHEELIEAKKQLEMYRVQYNHARSEIVRGEDVLATVSDQLQSAERDAVRARSQAHKTEQKRAVLEALIEGRRMGMLSGYAQAQREIGEFRSPQIAATEEYEEEEEEGEEEGEDLDEEEEYEEPPRPVPRTDTTESYYFPPPPHAAPPTVPSAHTLSPTETEEPLPPRSPSVHEFHVEVPPAEYPQSFHHPQYATAPDNFIPTLDASGAISMPPPHEWNSAMRAASPQPEESDKKGKGKAKNNDDFSEYSYTAPGRATSFNASVDTLTGLGILEPDGRGKFSNLDPIRESSASVDNVPLPPVQGHPSSVRSQLKSPNIASAGSSSPVGINVQTPSSHTPSSAKRSASRRQESFSSDRPPSRQQPLPPHDKVQLSTNHEWDQTGPSWVPARPPSSQSHRAQGRPSSANHANSSWQAPPSREQTPVPAESPPLPNPFPPPRASSSHSRHKSTGALTPEMVSNPLPSRARTPSMRSQNLLTPEMGLNPLPSLRHVPSNLSQRSHGKFEHFDQQNYVDPAIIGGEESQVDLRRIPSRPTSSVGFGLARTKSRGSTVRGE